MASPQEDKIQIVAFSTNDTSQTPNDIINIFLGQTNHEILKKSKFAIAFSTVLKNRSKPTKIMICSVLNLTKEYSGITDVNCYLLFIDLEKKDSIEKMEAIINYAKDYCQLGKKIFVLGMISGNEEDEVQIKQENCLCGYNPDGKKYCLLGSGNKNYTKYISKLKDYYLYNKNCHLSERTDEGCQKDLLSNDSYIITKIHELKNAKYWAKSNNKLIRAPICAYKVELPDFDGDIDDDPDIPPIPGEGKCAIYKCENSNEGFCAKSNYKNAFNINVSLYDICSENVFCKIGGEPNEVFYNGTNVKSKCYSNELTLRYPGEKCNLDSECVYPINNPSSQFHKCEDGRCTGMDFDGICDDNTWCLAGYYCDKFSGKCKEQKMEDEKCTETKECQNNLICLDSKCQDKLFSLDNGKSIPEYEDLEIQKRFCQSGEALDNKCVSYNDIDKPLDNNNYNKCSYGTFCKYKVIGLDNEKNINFPCPCGYNSEGQGYCPHFHEYWKDERNEYQDILKNNYDNECHTENRYNCYEKDKEEKEKELKNKIVNGHLFYNSVPCAKKVLDGEYLGIRKMIIAFVILFTLI